MEINDKVAVVTGGASGLGLAAVEKFLKKGAKVAIWDRDAARVNAVAEELGENCMACTVDVVDEAIVKQALDDVQARFGTPRILVNCAGVGMAGRTVGKHGPLDLDLFKQVISINLIGSFNTLRLIADAISKERGADEYEDNGVIINTASVAAFDGQIGQAAYSASKGGVVGMTLPIARDLRGFGIRVMSIAPGVFSTPLLTLMPDMQKQILVDMVQFPRRLGHPEEYGQLAVHIVENSYLNGETIRLDGAIRMAPK